MQTVFLLPGCCHWHLQLRWNGKDAGTNQWRKTLAQRVTKHLKQQRCELSASEEGASCNKTEWIKW